jgi:hypothetical protein
MANKADEIIEECKNQFDEHAKNCSGFVKAVAKKNGIELTGQADDIVEQIQKDGWTILKDGVNAKAKADAGWFVVAGLAAKNHLEEPPPKNGHVVIVVKGDLSKEKYPTAFWGSIGGNAKKEARSISLAWKKVNHDNIVYSGRKLK